MKIDVDCKEVSRLLSRRQDHRLRAHDWARARWHLAICQDCRNVEVQLDFLRLAMQGLDSRAEPRRR
jgi:hypothetical protein